MLPKSSILRNGLTLFLMMLLTACASSGAPVEDARSQQVVPEIQTRPFEQTPQVSGEPLSSNRSTPPIVSKLLRQSEQAAKQQDWVRAESYLQRALRINPKNAVLWSRMAEAKLEQGKRDQAIQFARKSNAISSDRYLQKKNAEIMLSARQP